MDFGFLKKYLLVVGVGIFIHLATFYWGILLWVVFSPLIYCAYKYYWRDIAYPVILLGFVVGVCTFYWVWDFGEWECIAAIVYCFLFVVFFVFLMWWIFNYIKYPLGVFIPPLVWGFLMYLCSFTIIGEHSYNISVNQAMLGPVVDLIGGFALTGLIIFVNSLIAFYFLQKKDKKILVVLVLIVVVLMVSYFYGVNAKVKGDGFRVALIQGNFNQSWGWRVEHANKEILNTYIRLTKEAMSESPNLIVWPEYSIPSDLVRKEEVMGKIKILARELGVNLIVGGVKYGEGEKVMEGCFYNTAYVVNKEGVVVGTYDSVKPFPLGGCVYKGGEYPVFEVDGYRFAVVMCYEECYQWVFDKYKNDDLDFFVALSNDSRMASKAGLLIKSHHTKLRASENGKYVIRATNNGITQVVNPFGRVIGKIPINQEGFLVQDIYLQK